MDTCVVSMPTAGLEQCKLVSAFAREGLAVEQSRDIANLSVLSHLYQPVPFPLYLHGNGQARAVVQIRSSHLYTTEGFVGTVNG